MSIESRSKADFAVEVVSGVVCVTDLNLGHRSVTNDAENVIADLIAQGADLGRQPLIYRDSLGIWNGIWVRRGRFGGFYSLDLKDLTAAIAAALKRQRTEQANPNPK